MGWRERKDTTVDLEPTMRRKGIDFIPVAAAKLHTAENRVELADGRSVGYDSLVIATGPELAVDATEGFGPEGHTRSIRHADHTEAVRGAFEAFRKTPGPIITGTVQGASCYGLACDFTFIRDTALRRLKIRDPVPMTFITSEPYVGHLGLDGVGDTKGLLEPIMRDQHIKWMTSCRVQKVEDGKMVVEEIADDGSVKGVKEMPFGSAMMRPAFRGIPAVSGIEGLSNPRGFAIVDKYQRNPTFPNVFAVGVCVAIPPTGGTRCRSACRRPAS